MSTFKDYHTLFSEFESSSFSFSYEGYIVVNRYLDASTFNNQPYHRNAISNMLSRILLTDKKISYYGLSVSEVAAHIAPLIVRVWRLNAVEEKRTATTAFFFMKYLETRGFIINDEVCWDNLNSFRKAMVKAIYHNHRLGIEATTDNLEKLLMQIIEGSNCEKVDIRHMLLNLDSKMSISTKNHISRLFESYGTSDFFGCSQVMELTGLKHAGASKLIIKMKEQGIIVPVLGYGKGKYRFNQSLKGV